MNQNSTSGIRRMPGYLLALLFFTEPDVSAFAVEGAHSTTPMKM